MKPCLYLTAVLLSGCTSYEVVLDDLNQHDANLALVVLRKSLIDAQKESFQKKKTLAYQIKVKKTQAELALNILVNQLPKVNRAGLNEIFPPGSKNLISSKSDEMARLIMAHQGEIESLLKIVPGVLDAKVVLSFEQAEFNRIAAKKTASVALIYDAKEKKPPLLDREVKELISAGISGLEPEDVAVIQKMSPEENYQPKPEDQPLPWQLLITVLALLVAAYATARLLWHRNKDLYAKNSPSGP